MPGRAVEVPLSGDNLEDHPIITGSDSWPALADGGSSRVSSVVTRSFSALYPNSFARAVVNLRGQPDIINTQDLSGVTSGVLFQMAIEGGPAMDGRVVLCGDSGWIGDTDSARPGPGEIQNGDNAQFALNTLAWLGRF